MKNSGEVGNQRSGREKLCKLGVRQAILGADADRFGDKAASQ
jgi:hypothetical protein